MLFFPPPKDYGAVVELDDGGEGWIHISEIKQGHVKKVRDELSLGQVVEAVCVGRNARGNAQMSLKQSSMSQSRKK